MIGIESVWKRFWRGSSGQRVVAKVGSLPPMLQPGGSCCTTSVKVGPQKVQNRPPLTFGIGQRRVLQRWVQLLPNIQLIGAIVPLIGIEPKTRLLIFCPWRKSTSIPPVLPPPRNRITPVNITRPLSIFPATAHPTTFDSYPPLLCFVQDAASLIFSYFHSYCLQPNTSRAVWIVDTFNRENCIWPFLLFSFPPGQEIFSPGGTSNQKRQTTDKLKRTFWTR